MVGQIKGQYQSPFDLQTVSYELVNIVTGRVASSDVEQSLSGFLDAGEAQQYKFVTERLSEGHTRSFWDTMPRLKTKTFRDMKKTASAGESSINSNSEVLFRFLLAVANSRDVKMKTVPRHELAAIPPSMFHEDKSMRKTNMADLAKKLESHCEEQQLLPEKITDGSVYNMAYIVDGMALNVSLFKTIDDLAHVVLKKLTACHHRDKSVSSVTIVVDRYDTCCSKLQLSGS
jgi:hypothetical protein